MCDTAGLQRSHDQLRAGLVHSPSPDSSLQTLGHESQYSVPTDDYPIPSLEYTGRRSDAQATYPSPLAFTTAKMTTLPMEPMHFTTLSASLHLPHSSVVVRELEHAIASDTERLHYGSQEQLRTFPAFEQWQGDWQNAASVIASTQAMNAHSGVESTSSASLSHSNMTEEERRQLEVTSQELIAKTSCADSSSYDIFPSMSTNACTTNRPPTERIDAMEEQIMPTQNNDDVPDRTLLSTRPGQDIFSRTPEVYYGMPALFAPEITVSRGHVLLEEPLIKATRDQNQVFTLNQDGPTGEIGWLLDKQSSQSQSSPLLLHGANFPIRPLHNGVLANLHNEWLDEYPSIAEGEHASDINPARNASTSKRFPTPSETIESRHVRSMWQELERRRILELNDDSLLVRLRQKASALLKAEQARLASISYPGLSKEQLMNTLPDPSEVLVNQRAEALWKQTRKAAIYTVGMLRQVEYCVAQANLGFTPLNYGRDGPPTMDGRAPSQHHFDAAPEEPLSNHRYGSGPCLQQRRTTRNRQKGSGDSTR